MNRDSVTVGIGEGERAAGRSVAVQLTALGKERLQAASAAVSSIEGRMRRGLDAGEQQQLRGLLTSCVKALSES
jgi:DNA-binding MarR family transcriptional regulator